MLVHVSQIGAAHVGGMSADCRSLTSQRSGALNIAVNQQHCDKQISFQHTRIKLAVSKPVSLRKKVTLKQTAFKASLQLNAVDSWIQFEMHVTVNHCQVCLQGILTD